MTIKILVVDDYVASAVSLEQLFSLRGFKTSSVANAPEARKALRSETYDVLVIDYRMDPLLTGLDMIRWCRQNKIYTPVLLTSGIEKEVLEQALESISKEHLEPVVILSKPAPGGEMLDTVERLAKVAK